MKFNCENIALYVAKILYYKKFLILYSIEYPSIVEENIRKVRQTIQEVKVTFNNISYNVTSTVDQFRCMYLYSV